MTADLRDALDQVAREGTDDIHLPALASGAVRRRRARQVRRICLLGSALAPAATPSTSGGSDRGATCRRGRARWPVCSTGRTVAPDGGRCGQMVAAIGCAAQSSTTRDRLSADGRRRGYVTRDGEHVVVHDLVSGRRTVLDGVGDARLPGSEGRLGLAGQTPAFWSPRGDVLAGLGFSASQSGVVLVDARRGSVRLVDAVGSLVGWLPDGSAFVTVDVRTKELPNADPEIVTGPTVNSGVRAHVVGVGGGDTSVDLVPGGGWPSHEESSQWSWAVSPDGSTLLAASQGVGSTDGVSLRRFRLSDGREIGSARQVADATGTCTIGWVGAHLVSVPVLDSHQQLSRVLLDLRTGGVRPATVVSRHLGDNVQCLEESRLALAGPAVGGGLLGLSTATWLWLVGALVVVLAALVVVRRRQPA